jgi:hypothetical protein
VTCRLAAALLVSAVLVVPGVLGCRRPVGGGTITIDPADQRCLSDEDCTTTMTRCTGDCGSPINRLHARRYLDLQERMCRDYEGPMRKMSCPGRVVCMDGVCAVVPEQQGAVPADAP